MAKATTVKEAIKKFEETAGVAAAEAEKVCCSFVPAIALELTHCQSQLSGFCRCSAAQCSLYRLQAGTASYSK